MAKPKVKNEVVGRNVRLTGEIIKYMLNNPKMLDVLPEKFELVLLPERSGIAPTQLGLARQVWKSGQTDCLCADKNQQNYSPIPAKYFRACRGIKRANNQKTSA
jgi:hypothetical protein